MIEYSVSIECPTTVRASSVAVAAEVIEEALTWSETRPCEAICTELDDGGDGPDEVTEHPDGSVTVTFALYVRFLDYLSDVDEAKTVAVRAARSLVDEVEIFLENQHIEEIITYDFSLDLATVEVTDMAQEMARWGTGQ